MIYLKLRCVGILVFILSFPVRLMQVSVILLIPFTWKTKKNVTVIIDIDNLVFPLLHFTPSLYKDIFSKIRNISYPC